MNNILGEKIARLRKERGMTQEDLARELNISYQAVSKWENGVSSPDISNIKLLAQFFGVSIDALFGLELLPEREEVFSSVPETDAEILPDPEGPATREICESAEEWNLPWENDDTLRVVMFRGRELLSAEEISGGGFGRGIRLEYGGEALNVFSFFDVSCDAVNGNASAGGDLSCGAVGGSVSAGGDVSCGTVGGSVSAGGDVDCETVGSAVNCGGDVDCGDVGGDVRAGGDADCGTVIGNVSAGGDVDCGSVGGNVTAEGDVDCGTVRGSVIRK